MVKYIFGKSGRSAPKQIAWNIKTSHKTGGLDIKHKKIDDILKMTEKVFKQNGKEPYKIKERDFVKEISNRYKLGSKYNAETVKKVEDMLGITERTKQIGTKYSSATKQEKKSADKKRFEEAKIAKAEKIEKSKIDLSKKARGTFKQPDNRLEGTKVVNNLGINNRFGGVKGGNQLGVDNHFGGMPKQKDSVQSVADAYKKSGALKSGGMFRRGAGVSVVPKDLSGVNLKPDMLSDSDFKYGGFRQRIVQEPSGDEIPSEVEVPDWRFAAYADNDSLKQSGLGAEIPSGASAPSNETPAPEPPGSQIDE